MSPKVLSATYTHETPAAKRPSPKARPRAKARPGEEARCQSANRPASVSAGRRDAPNGEKLKTVAAPSRSAASVASAAGIRGIKPRPALVLRQEWASTFPLVRCKCGDCRRG